MQQCQVYTGSAIDVFRWKSVISQLKLEKVGLKSSGGALRPRLAAQLGLKPRDSHDKFIQAIETKIAAIRESENVQTA
jgi:hypothetical protein